MPKVLERELYDTDEQKEKFIDLESKLNNDQREIFEMLRACPMSNTDRRQFCVNALAGYGKTFLFNCLSSFVRMNCGICLCMASTGIAAWNMQG